MRILHIVRQFSPSVGGLESYVMSMAQHMEKQGHTCEILTLNKLFAKDSNNTSLPSKETIQGLTVRRIGFIGRQRYFIPMLPISYIRSFDIIHVHNTDGFFDFLAFLAPIIQRPMFATTHGGFFHTNNFGLIKKIYFQTVTRLSCLAYKTIFATSENDMETFKAITSKLDLKPNAVEPLGDFICQGDDFIYIGRLAKHKGVDKILQTFAEFARSNKGNLHIVGPEWDVKRDVLKQLAVDLKISDRVKIHGFLSTKELNKVLHQCGYFVSASQFEGFGMSMIEAMSVGLLPIVESNASFRTLIEQAKIGEYTNFSDSAQASKTMTKVIKSANGETRKKAQQFSKQFSWSKLAETTLSTYTKGTSIS